MASIDTPISSFLPSLQLKRREYISQPGFRIFKVGKSEFYGEGHDLSKAAHAVVQRSEYLVVSGLCFTPWSDEIILIEKMAFLLHWALMGRCCTDFTRWIDLVLVLLVGIVINNLIYEVYSMETINQTLSCHTEIVLISVMYKTSCCFNVAFIMDVVCIQIEVSIQ